MGEERGEGAEGNPGGRPDPDDHVRWPAAELGLLRDFEQEAGIPDAGGTGDDDRGRRDAFEPLEDRLQSPARPTSGQSTAAG
jgi:hypothetical protein